MIEEYNKNYILNAIAEGKVRRSQVVEARQMVMHMEQEIIRLTSEVEHWRGQYK